VLGDRNWATHGLQFGPLKFTTAVAGLKFDPLMVNENTCPATGGLGLVAIPEIAGGGEEDTAGITVSETLFDAVPAVPFCTVTVKAPAIGRVTDPTSWEAVLVADASWAAHGKGGAQPGPLKFTSALAGLKFVPVMVNENCWPATGGLGVVLIPEITGCEGAAAG